MATTDTTEKGLEALIVRSLVEGTGYVPGDPHDYDRDHAVDLAKLFAFLAATQPDTVKALNLRAEGPSRTQFLHRLQGQVATRGVIDVLRKGVSHGPAHVDLFYGTPTPGNAKAAELFAKNLFSVTRQLRYSKAEAALALDLVIFINGLPVITFELKNKLTKQTVADAVVQYQRDRDPKELLFQFGRCVVHFAVDDHRVKMCTHLTGKASWFLPFDKGFDDGAGNPPNPSGLATDYLWKETLTKPGLTEILEDYAQIVEETDERGKKKRKQIFPRYHQFDVVRKLLADALARGAGRRYLVQHSAGSGKSNSITWLAHQLVELKKDGQPVFDTVVVVTDRRVLDKQIRDNIKQFAQVAAVVGAVTQGSSQLREFIQAGKKIVITTVQKFPLILDEIGSGHQGRRFAILIDEAHSSQGGRTSAAMNVALSGTEQDEEETTEDRINAIMESRKMLPNASYFAFTATPKNKTLQLFGDEQPDGSFRPFHHYTMKQAIQEGFILDVLKAYTPVNSYYQLVKKVEDDPEFDAKKAQKKLRRYVESHEHAIRQKAEIMIDHFHEQVLARRKVGGRARAMVVTSGIRRAIQYKEAFDAYLKEAKSPHKAIVAFSGEHEHGGAKVTEATMNGFPSSKIEESIRQDPYRFLIVADKFQTGYDEPLLHTMYVDKQLSGVKAVQTLSRLNRAHPQKYDTFVLDFMNDADTIQKAFEPYYRTTVLSEATDPNKLHDLKADLDGYQVYSQGGVDEVVRLYLGGADRDKLDPILDACVAAYTTQLDEDGQVGFKGKAKAFVRTYSFLAAVLPFSHAAWEKLSIFLNFLVPKLPAPVEEDLAKGILETIDMDSYRVEVRAQRPIPLADAEGEVGPVPTSSGGHKPEPELDRLSNIVRAFNDLFGNVDWKDADKIHKVITEEIPAKVSADEAYQNAKTHSDKQNARIEHDRVLGRVIIELLADHTELFKQFSDNPSFKKWLSDTIFELTYEEAATAKTG
jgi:type I restriction enzyme, R subunit